MELLASGELPAADALSCCLLLTGVQLEGQAVLLHTSCEQVSDSTSLVRLFGQPAGMLEIAGHPISRTVDFQTITATGGPAGPDRGRGEVGATP